MAAGTREVLFNIFEGLVKPNSDGEMIPAVAEKYTLSEDGTTYTFTLREGVKFHNGQEVTPRMLYIPSIAAPLCRRVRRSLW